MKKVAIFILTLLFVFNLSSAFCALDIDAQAYILIDAKTGNVLYEYQPDLRLRPASTTKIMTALVALKKGKMDQLMTASNEAVSDIGLGGMNIGIMSGEQMKLKDLMHAFLIVSASEAANVVSENVFADRAEFITEMNKIAIEVGAKNSTFTNPCGVDEYEKDANHFSTARDLALIAKECMKYPLFKDIINQKRLDMLPPTNKHPKWNVLNSTNKILGKSYRYGPKTGDDRYQFTITGMKTGSTLRAGANFVASAVNKDGLELISVILGVSNKQNRSVFDFTEILLRAGYENFSYQMVIDRNTLIKSDVQVKDASDDGKLNLVTNAKLEALLPNNTDEWKSKINKKITLKQDLKAPIKKGTVLGNIALSDGNNLIGKIDIVASRTVEKSLKAQARDYTKNIMNKPLFKYISIIVIIIVFFLIMRKTLQKISRKRKYRMKQHLK